jgi:hypothetical protein
VGAVIPGELEKGKVDSLLQTDTFRKGLQLAVSSQDVWPLFLLLMSCLFFADVFVRRVTISFDWVGPAVSWLRGKVFGIREQEHTEQRLEQLRSRKAAIAEQIDDRRAATRFEPVPDQLPGAKDAGQILSEAAGGTPPQAPQTPRPSAQLTPHQPESESYTSRLLKAKQQARRDTDK